MQQTGGIQSVQKSFAILEQLAVYADGASIKQLTETMNLPKSTVHHLLCNLIGMGYVTQLAENGRYRATLKMFEIGSQVVGQIDMVAVARSHLNNLAAEVGETIHLVVRDGCQVVYVFKAESGGMRMSSRIGSRMPLYSTGVGKAILSGMPYAEVQSIWNHSEISPYTPKTILTFERLEKELAQARRDGWAMDDEENELGIRCVATALPRTGGTDAAFSISGMSVAMDEERMKYLAQCCLRVKHDILAELGVR